MGVMRIPIAKGTEQNEEPTIKMTILIQLMCQRQEG
jgi:hypothetical protein